jgi:hypothetical protein
MAERIRIEQAHLRSQNAFYDVLGEPVFLSKEERENYLKLRDAIEELLSPQNLFDFQDVADIAYHIVEIRRFQRAHIAMIKSPVMLADLLKFAFGENTDKAREVALQYYGTDAKKAEQATKMIEQAGMTSEQVQGHAIVAQSMKVQLLDHLVQLRESSNLRMIKGLEKRQKRRVERTERNKSVQQDSVASLKQNGKKGISSPNRPPRIVSSNGD